MTERPVQHSSPSLHPASVNQAPPQRGIPTPQQNFLSSTPQSNLTQISSHVSANGLPSNSVLAQINGAPPQQSPQITHPPSQPPIQPNKLPCLSEDRFKSNFVQFTRSKGLRLSERDLVFDGRPVNLWALHRAVFSRNGFDSVSLIIFTLKPQPRPTFVPGIRTRRVACCWRDYRFPCGSQRGSWSASAVRTRHCATAAAVVQ